jgi:hypothetical protein
MFLTNPQPRISKHPQPSPIFLPIGWMPRVLHGTEAAFWMRHHDGETAIGVG